MVLVRKSETKLLQGIFTTYPDLTEWPTKDLYSKHPTKTDHWLYEGRADDIIVFSNGEKLNPMSLEQSIEAHSEVKSAVVIGTGRFEPGLLIDRSHRTQITIVMSDFSTPYGQQCSRQTVRQLLTGGLVRA